MAPRKRRGRSSGLPAASTAAAGSGSNSAATSSPSSQPISKSDNESIPDKIGSDVPRPPRKSIASDAADHAAHSKHAASRVVRPSNERSASMEEPSHSADPRTSQEANKANPHTQLLFKTFQAGHKMLAETDTHDDHFTVASVAMQLYDDMINWAVTEVAVQFKRQAYLEAEANRRATVFQKHTGKHESKGSKGTQRSDGLRVAKIAQGKYGSRLLYSEKNVNVECSNCGSSVSASRYAQHVEKCLGRGGRMSSRAASARLRASAERAEKEAAADMDEVPTRRRRHSSSVASGSHDAGDNGYGSASGGASGKRRKMSPVPSAGSAGISQGGSLQHSRAGLPPSGRTRASPP